MFGQLLGKSADPDDFKYAPRHGPQRVRLMMLAVALAVSCVVLVLISLQVSVTRTNAVLRAGTNEALGVLEGAQLKGFIEEHSEATERIKSGKPPCDSTSAQTEEFNPHSPYPEWGFVRRPRIPEGERTPDDGKLHIIFSSGCNFFQHWQSEMLLASAAFVGQRGRITRIVSGCHDRHAETVQHRHQTFPEGKGDKLVPLHKLNRSLNEDFGLFITPSFPGAVDFPWINKPNSIRFFMENAREELEREGETVIAILDPDFIFLKPLSQSNTDPSQVITSRSQSSISPGGEPIDWVMPGKPVAQRYGLEGAWVGKFNVTEITGDAKSPALEYTEQTARKHFSVGPPLMLHVDDLTPLSKLWAEYMPRVLHRDKDILADMWAYSIASAHLGLRHVQLDNYMISTHGTSGQGYAFVDAYKDLDCLDPRPKHGETVPEFIHMASNFKAPDRKKGPWMFHKGHVPPDILECDSPLIIDAPNDLWRITEGIAEKQHAWILCHTVHTLNKVALLYKQKFCECNFESRQLIRLIQRKTRDRTCRANSRHNKPLDKWCYPLAQIEGLPEDWRDNLGS